MDATPPPTPPTRNAWMLSWPALLVLFALPGVAWALAGPLFGAPDEPSHSVKAVALWSGQLSGEDATSDAGHLTTTFQLPAVWAQATVVRDCFAFAPMVTADCAPPFAGSVTTTGVETTAGHYPPLFYALVGWGGRLSSGPIGLYVMRIAGAVVCGALLASAVRALARVMDPRLAVAGVLVAATPMVLFLAGSVNPNGLEICAAIAVWASLVALLHRTDRSPGPAPTPLVVQLVVVGSIMALSRTLSPMFLGLIAILAAASVPTAVVRRLLRDRSARIGGVVLVGVAAGAMASVALSGALASTPGRIGTDGANPAIVILGETDGYVAEMIGVFGWLDTQPPSITLFLWLGAVFGLLALGLALGTPRSAIGLLAVLGTTIALPVIVQYPSAAAQGLPWQGRYTLPIAVGIPLLAVVIIDRKRALVPGLASRASVGIAAITGVASVAAFAWTLRRYTTGATGSLRIWSGAWQPPGGSLALVLVMVAFAVAAVAVAVRTGSDPPRVAIEPDERGATSPG